MGSRNRSTETQISNAQRYVSAPTVHDRMREQLAKDVEAFLALGGEIKHLDPHLRSNLNDIDTESDSY
ncbi:hypothetical protein [Zhongshania aliphaticivorans]|uniref:hypothetical protein n=1 Tax=Zhongshania aliphaticivorans TaxID=1470434 RepID=UPI0012E5452D|nr:hypothetical protein [Zhongshania aliphaticivorans]CAA0118195.1 Uncharacterised protein [Zhongshania aliphaticivorans]